MDDRLRALERAARSNPGDREGVWAFVRALEQSGDAGAAWTERRRLARSGDDQAWRELSPAPRGATRLALCATRTVGRVHGDVITNGRSLFLLEGTALRAFDARTLEPIWSAVASGNDAGALWGAYLVHGGTREGALVVRAQVDGEEVATFELGRSWEVGSVLASPDHVVAVFDRTDDDRPNDIMLVDVATGAPAAVGVRAWPEAAVVDWPILARDVLIQCTPRHSTSARELTSTRVRWTHEGRPLCADARHAFTKGPPGRSFQVACVDVATGRQRWTHDSAPASDLRYVLGPELLVLASTLRARYGRGVEVRAIDRDTGEVRWSVRDAHDQVFSDVAVAQGVVYLACGGAWAEEAPARGLDELTISCFAACTGERVGTLRVPLDDPGLGPRLLSVDGGVLVMVRGAGGTWFGRVGED